MAEVASAWVSLLPSAKGFGSKLESEVGGEVKSSGSKLGKTFGKMFAVGGGLLAAAGVGTILSGSIDEAREAQKVGALTESIIKSTGGAAKITAVEVGNLSSSLSAKIGVDDELIQSGANLLLTFKNVRNEVGEGNKVFNRATKAAADLSAAGFGDLEGQAKMLGKALNDPVKGMTALTRSGVTFSAEQTNMVKKLVESGQMLKAQKIILGEVESQVGGAAAATATAGDKAAVALGNLKEQAGTALLPVIDSLANTFTTKLAPGISSFITGMQTGTGAGGQFVAVITTARDVLVGTIGFVNQHRTAITALAVAVGAVVVVTKAHAAAMAIQAAGGLALMIKSLPIVTGLTKAYAAGQWLLNAALTANPIGIVVVALVALGAGLVVAYKKSQTFRKIVDGAFSAVLAIGRSVANFFTKQIPAAFNVVKSAASSVLGWVKSNWPTILTLLTGPFGVGLLIIQGKLDGVTKAGQGVLDWFKALPAKILSAFSGAGTMLLTVGNQIIDGLTAGIRAAAGRVMDAVNSVINAIPSKIRKLMGIASPSKVTTKLGFHIAEGLAKGLKDGSTKVLGVMEDTLGKLESRLGDMVSRFESLASSVASAFNPSMFGVSGKEAVSETVDGIATVLEPATTAMQEFMSGLTSNNSNLTTMLAAVDQLKAAGASTGFLSGLMESGNLALATQLATAGPAAVQQASALFDQNASLAATLGGKVATNELGPKMDGVREEIALLRQDIANAPKPPRNEAQLIGAAAAAGIVNGGNKVARRGKKGGGRGR